MIVLALEQGIYGFGIRTLSPGAAIAWNQARTFVGGMLPGIWLLFSLSFGRENYRDFTMRWKWFFPFVFAIPFILAVVFKSSFFKNVTVIEPSFGWSLSLGWPGTVFHVFFLLVSVVIVVNLEYTLRGFSGSIQWKIKFMILGVFCLFASRIYTSSQILLYSSFHSSFDSVNAGAGIAACVLIAISLYRSHLSDINIYFSRTFIFNSIAIFIISFYLVAVGILAEIVKHIGKDLAFPLEVLFIIFALIALAVLLLSDEFRHRIKIWLNRNLQRSDYDYRGLWSNFSRRTMSRLDQREFCATVTKMISDVLGSPAVTIWLLDEKMESASLGGSTFHSMAEERSFKLEDETFSEVADLIRDNRMPRIIKRVLPRRPKAVQNSGEYANRYTREWCCVPLKAADEFVGLMTLSQRESGGAFSVEDLDLLQTIADQTAYSLMNLRISEKLREAKQLEAFQTIAAFFVHDLKNLASTLSLTLKNLPIHFDNPEFREDALRIISGSVDKINNMCGRLSSINSRLELNRVKTDLNELIEKTIDNMNGFTKGVVDKELESIPRTIIDQDQIQKILVNLILNASEAIAKDGKIRVASRRLQDRIEVSVIDNGCGISEEFLEKSLFQPFKTTKKKGLGIGLFQCKRIAEAHGGRIEADSEPGKGSTFRLLLPHEENHS